MPTQTKAPPSTPSANGSTMEPPLMTVPWLLVANNVSTQAGGIKIPLNIVNGLARMPMRPYTDAEWNTLPIVPSQWMLIGTLGYLITLLLMMKPDMMPSQNLQTYPSKALISEATCFPRRSTLPWQPMLTCRATSHPIWYYIFHELVHNG